MERFQQNGEPPEDYQGKKDSEEMGTGTEGKGRRVVAVVESTKAMEGAAPEAEVTVVVRGKLVGELMVVAKERLEEEATAAALKGLVATVCHRCWAVKARKESVGRRRMLAVPASVQQTNQVSVLGNKGLAPSGA